MTAVSGNCAPVPHQEALLAAAPGFDPGASRRGEFITLRAVFGQDEANHGTQRYRVDNDGLLRVPREVAEHLLHNGGYVVHAHCMTRALNDELAAEETR
jgi:hypothetical protein